MGLQVVGAANAGVGHDRRAAAGLVGGGGAAIAVAAGVGAAVERVPRPKLMPHLVRDVVNVKAVADRLQKTNPRLPRENALFLARHWAEVLPDGSARLLALADELSELKTICHCGRKATMVVRVGAGGPAPAAARRRTMSSMIFSADRGPMPSIRRRIRFQETASLGFSRTRR